VLFEPKLLLRHQKKHNKKSIEMTTTQENLPMQIDFLISQVGVIQEILLKRIIKPEEVPKKRLTFNETLSHFFKQGHKMSKSRLYKLTSSNSIPNYKIGNKLLFCVDELDQWLNNQIVRNEYESLQTNLPIIKSAQFKTKTI
jgi:excisionase family DNA binding protein